MDKKFISAETKYKILKKLLVNGNLSRAELAKKLKFSKPAVADNVGKLLESEIIREIGEGSSAKTGGRKPILLEVNKNYRYIISIDLSFLNPVCAIGNMKYEMLYDTTLLVAENEGEEHRLAAIDKAIDMLLKKVGASPEMIGSIIVSSPGVIGENDIYYTNPQFSNWTGVNFKKYLKEKYDIPVSVKNDVNMALLAEMEMGKGKKQKNLTYLNCGLGIGSGVAIGRKIYEGERFAAGEIGNFIESSDYKSGVTLEKAVNVKSLLERIEKEVEHGADTLLRERKGKIEFADLVEAYKKDDAYVKEVFYGIGIRLGVAISNMVSLLDLDMVILGGLYSEFYEIIHQGIREVISNVDLIDPVIEKSVFNSKACIYGAFVIGTEQILKKHLYN